MLHSVVSQNEILRLNSQLFL